MDILIKGMEMPRGNNVLVVDSAGTITKVNRWTGKVEATDPFSVKAVALPEHGDLVDRSFLKGASYEIIRFSDEEANNMFLELIDNAPTILETNNGSDN